MVLTTSKLKNATKRKTLLHILMTFKSVEAKENFEQNIFALLENYPQKRADSQNQQMQTLKIYQDLFANLN